MLSEVNELLIPLLKFAYLQRVIWILLILSNLRVLLRIRNCGHRYRKHRNYLLKVTNDIKQLQEEYRYQLLRNGDSSRLDNNSPDNDSGNTIVDSSDLAELPIDDNHYSYEDSSSSNHSKHSPLVCESYRKSSSGNFVMPSRHIGKHDRLVQESIRNSRMRLRRRKLYTKPHLLYIVDSRQRIAHTIPIYEKDYRAAYNAVMRNTADNTTDSTDSL